MPIEIKDGWVDTAIDVYHRVYGVAFPDAMRAALEAIAPLIAEECAKIAASYATPGRFKVPATWTKEFTPTDVYQTGAIDAAVWIEQEIRARATGKKELQK